MQIHGAAFHAALVCAAAFIDVAAHASTVCTTVPTTACALAFRYASDRRSTIGFAR